MEPPGIDVAPQTATSASKVTIFIVHNCISRVYLRMIKLKFEYAIIYVMIWKNFPYYWYSFRGINQLKVTGSFHTPDSKVHGANMRLTWVLSAIGGPHVGPMNLAIRDTMYQILCKHSQFVMFCYDLVLVDLTPISRANSDPGEYDKYITTCPY